MRAHTHTSSCPCFLPGSGSLRVEESGFDAKFCFVLELVPDGGVVGCVGVGLLEPLKQFVGRSNVGDLVFLSPCDSVLVLGKKLRIAWRSSCQCSIDVHTQQQIALAMSEREGRMHARAIIRHAHQREHISTLFSLLEQGHLGDLDKRRQLAWPGLPVHHTLDNEGIIVVARIAAIRDGCLAVRPAGSGVGGTGRKKTFARALG
jgi:hypothetical protein